MACILSQIVVILVNRELSDWPVNWPQVSMRYPPQLLYPDSESIQMLNKYSKIVSNKARVVCSFKVLFPLLNSRAASSSTL